MLIFSPRTIMSTQQSSGQRQLSDRVLSWLSSVSPSYPPPIDTLPSDHDLLEYNYQRPSSPSSSTSWHSGQMPPVSPEVSSYAMELDFEEDVSLYRYRSDIYGNVPEFSMFYAPSPLETLPDPVSNPLITLSPDVIEEEYARILEMRNDLQANYDELLRQQRVQAKQQPWEIYDWTIEQQLFEASLAIQKANSAAEYMVDFCVRHNIQIDFLSLSLSHIRLPPAHQPLPATEFYDNSRLFTTDAAIHNQSYVYEQGLQQHHMVDWVS
ncbi:hypothetical protein BDQ17DRAFT_1347381 [Cyathus striatus]|nr:hypothetical protein BDQ17DRAFT_1347381 [Cyathus striatus]